MGPEVGPPTGDPRVYFAAERTLLAWVRTGITVIALGFVVERFGLFLALFTQQAGAAARPTHAAASNTIGTLLVLAGVAVIVLAAFQHVRYVRTLPAEDVPAGWRTDFALVFALAFAVLGAALAVFLALS